MFNQSWLLPDAYNERLFPQTNGWTAVVRTDYSETRNFTPTQTANTRPTARRWFAFYDKVGASIPGPVNFTSTTAASRKPIDQLRGCGSCMVVVAMVVATVSGPLNFTSTIANKRHGCLQLACQRITRFVVGLHV